MSVQSASGWIGTSPCTLLSLSQEIEGERESSDSGSVKRLSAKLLVD